MVGGLVAVPGLNKTKGFLKGGFRLRGRALCEASSMCCELISGYIGLLMPPDSAICYIHRKSGVVINIIIHIHRPNI